MNTPILTIDIGGLMSTVRANFEPCLFLLLHWIISYIDQQMLSNPLCLGLFFLCSEMFERSEKGSFVDVTYTLSDSNHVDFRNK